MTPWKRNLRILPAVALLAVVAAGPFPALAQESGQSAKPPADAAKKADASKRAAGSKDEKKEGEPGLKSAEAAAEALRTEGKIVSQEGDLQIDVDANYFSEFPGFDLSTLGEPQREWLLRRANHVYCTCGCRGDTIARCVVLDPTCQTARKMLQGLLDKARDLTPEEAAADAASPAPATP